MPIYSFTCPKCGYKDERVRAMKNASMPCKCLKCGAKMNRDMKADLPFVSGGEYKKLIISDSLAVSANQVNEHRQLFPDIKILDDGRPVFENYQSHNNYLKKTGFYKKQQKIKKKGKRIA